MSNSTAPEQTVPPPKGEVNAASSVPTSSANATPTTSLTAAAAVAHPGSPPSTTHMVPPSPYPPGFTPLPYGFPNFPPGHAALPPQFAQWPGSLSPGDALSVAGSSALPQSLPNQEHLSNRSNLAPPPTDMTSNFSSSASDGGTPSSTPAAPGVPAVGAPLPLPPGAPMMSPYPFYHPMAHWYPGSQFYPQAAPPAPVTAPPPAVKVDKETQTPPDEELNRLRALVNSYQEREREWYQERRDLLAAARDVPRPSNIVAGDPAVRPSYSAAPAQVDPPAQAPLEQEKAPEEEPKETRTGPLPPPEETRHPIISPQLVSDDPTEFHPTAVLPSMKKDNPDDDQEENEEYVSLVDNKNSNTCSAEERANTSNRCGRVPQLIGRLSGSQWKNIVRNWNQLPILRKAPRPSLGSADQFNYLKGLLRLVMKEIPMSVREFSTQKETREQEYFKDYAQLEVLGMVFDYGTAISKALWQIHRPSTVFIVPNIVEDGIPIPPLKAFPLLLNNFATKFLSSTKPLHASYKTELQRELYNLRKEEKEKEKDFIYISMEEMECAIKQTRLYTGADMTALDYNIVSRFPPALIEVFVQVFSAILRDGYCPPDWGRSIAIPVLRGSDKDSTKLSSYRPVMVSSMLCRVMETIVLHRLKHHMRGTAESGPRMNIHQVNCWPLGDLNVFLYHVVRSLYEGKHFRRPPLPGAEARGVPYSRLVVTVEFKHAVARLTPEKVEWVLRRKGTPVYIVRWIQAFFSSRKLQMWMCHETTQRDDFYNVGLPSDSVLGPFLVSLFMDDLYDELLLHCTTTHLTPISKRASGSEADHSRLTRQVAEGLQLVGEDGSCTPWGPLEFEGDTILPSICDFVALEDDLSLWVMGPTAQITAAGAQMMLGLIGNWSERNGFIISSKSSAMWLDDDGSHTTPPRPVRLTVSSDVTIQVPPLSEALRRDTAIRVLGLWIDPLLSFKVHVRKLKKDVKKVMDDLARNLPHISRPCKRVILECTAEKKIYHGLPVYWAVLDKGLQEEMEQLWVNLAECRDGVIKADNRLKSGYQRLLSYSYVKFQEELQRMVSSLPVSYRYYIFSPVVPEINSEGKRFRTEDVVDGKKSEQNFLQIEACHAANYVSPSSYGDIPFANLLKALKKCKFDINLPLLKANRALDFQSFNRERLESVHSDLDLWTAGYSRCGKSCGAFIVVENGSKIHEDRIMINRRASNQFMDQIAIRSGVEYLQNYLKSRRSTRIRIISSSHWVLEAVQRGPIIDQNENIRAIWAAVSGLPISTLTFMCIFRVPSEVVTHGNEDPDYFNCLVHKIVCASCTGKGDIRDDYVYESDDDDEIPGFKRSRGQCS